MEKAVAHKNLNILFDYDYEGDILYANVGEPRRTVAEELGNGIAIKHDPETGVIFGFTVIDYMKRINRNMISSIPHFENVKLPIYK